MSENTMIDEGKKSRWLLPKWGWALFVGSLALNLLVVGSIIGMTFFGDHHGKGGHGMRGVVRSLPAEKRDEVREILRKHRESVRPLRRDLRERRRELVAYARTADMDVVEFERRLADLGERRAVIRKRLEPLMLELARTLDPEARGRILSRLLRAGGRHGRRGRHRH